MNVLRRLVHGKGWFVMLKAYMDDSGTHADSPVCLIAGYWGGTNQWKQFEQRWKLVLDRHKVDEFHAKVFWGRDASKERIGPYKGWSDRKRHAFMEELLRVIGSVKVHPFAFGVLSSEWSKRTSWQKKILSGGSGKSLNNAPQNPMFMSFQTAILRICRYCHEGVAMHFVMDSNANTNGWSAICYNKAKKELATSEWGHLKPENLGDLVFSDSKKALPLQAADLLAYEAFKYAKWAKGDSKARMRREYALALRNYKSKEDFWLYDDVRFAKLEEAVVRTAK